MRNIKQALVTIIDYKLRDNGSAKKAIKDKDARSLLIYAAEACVGELEQGGDNHGTFVELCQKTVDDRANGESWCMGFVQSMIAYVETKLSIISPIASDENCLQVWELTPESQIVENIPKKGAIIIWCHTDTSTKKSINPQTAKRKFKYSGKGHTGFVIEYDFDSAVKTMTTVEGNTNKLGSSNGDGVFKKTNRNKIKEKGKDSLEVVGFLIPFKII